MFCVRCDANHGVSVVRAGIAEDVRTPHRRGGAHPIKPILGRAGLDPGLQQDFEGFQDVSLPEVDEPIYAHAALHAIGQFTDVVLEVP